jgi:hypothetical protein
MKRIVLVLAVIAFVSCKHDAKTSTESVDSTQVAVDTVAVDSVSVDTATVKVDSVK